MASNEKEIQIVVTGKNETSRAFGEVQKSIGVLNKDVSGFAKTLGVTAAGALAGFTALMVDSVKQFAAADASQRRFETSLKNITKATDNQIAALRKQQDALALKTRFDNDAIASAQGFLATFALTTDQIEKVTPKLLDMSEGLRKATGGTVDLESASNMLGKALQLGSVTMLQKVGITVPGVTKAQQDLFKSTFELANMQERVAMLTQLLDGNFKGAAESGGKSLEGQLDILKNQFGELQETVGGAIVEAINPFITQLTEWAGQPDVQMKIKEIAEVLGQLAAEWIPIAVGALKVMFNVTKEIVQVMIQVGDAVIRAAEAIEKFVNSAKKISSSVINSVKSVSSGIGSTVSNLFGGGKAMGGPVMGGTSYLVGEKGPEIFTPGSAGRITPNAGGAVTVNIYNPTLLNQGMIDALQIELARLIRQDFKF